MSGLGVNYSSVSKAVYALLHSRAWSHPTQILDAAASVTLSLPAVKSASMSARLPRALLHAQSAIYARTYTNPSPTPKETTVDKCTKGPLDATIEDLRLSCVIGLHPHERAEKQRLEVDITSRNVADGWSHKAVADCALEVSNQLQYTVYADIYLVPREILIWHAGESRRHICTTPPYPRARRVCNSHDSQAVGSALRDAKYLRLAQPELVRPARRRIPLRGRCGGCARVLHRCRRPA